MLQNYSLRIKLLICLFLVVSVSVSAVQLLHPGVKINSKAIETEMYLLTRDELDSFIAVKEDLKAAQAIIALRNARELSYENTIASLTQNLVSLSDKLVATHKCWLGLLKIKITY